MNTFFTRGQFIWNVNWMSILYVRVLRVVCKVHQLVSEVSAKCRRSFWVAAEVTVWNCKNAVQDV